MEVHKNVLTEWKGAAFQGGGVGALGHIGAIKVLNDLNILSKLTHVAGSSAGAIVATIVACRLPYETIKEIVSGIDYATLEDSSWLVIRDIYRIVHDLGWNSDKAIIKLFKDILQKYLGNKSITFGQIREKYGSFLIITATDVCAGNTVYYTPDTHPDMTIVKALRQSVSIPLFSPPVIEDNKMLVDGGTLDNYPIQKLYDYLSKEQVFGVKLTSNSKSCPGINGELPKNLIEYASRLIKIIRHQAAKVHINEDDWKRTIKVDIGTISTTDFNLTEEQKSWLISQGVLAGKQFFGV
jgi:NTE family protein